MRSWGSFLSLFFSAVLILFFPASASAQFAPQRPSVPPTNTVGSLSVSTPSAGFLTQDQMNIPRARLRVKLQGAALASCRAREMVIKTRSEQLLTRAGNMQTLFSDIAARVDAFYQTRAGQGAVLPNYQELKGSLDQQKAQIDKTMEFLSQDTRDFNCNGDDPSGVMRDFNRDMRSLTQMLKNYRLGVRNFIMAVHRAAAAAQQPGVASPSASASAGLE